MADCYDHTAYWKVFGKNEFALLTMLFFPLSRTLLPQAALLSQTSRFCPFNGIEKRYVVRLTGKIQRINSEAPAKKSS